MIEQLTKPAVAGPLVVAVVYLVYLVLFKKPQVPEGIPWIGRKSGPLANLRANLRGTLSSLKVFDEGYRKVRLIRHATILEDC
jgi:hypothetical protein